MAGKNTTGNRNGGRTNPLGPKSLTPAQIAAQEAADRAERRRLNDPLGGKSMANIVAAAPTGWTPGNGSIGNTYTPTTVKPQPAAAPLPPKAAAPVRNTGASVSNGIRGAPRPDPTDNMMVQGNQNLNAAAAATNGLLNYSPQKVTPAQVWKGKSDEALKTAMKFQPGTVDAARANMRAAQNTLQQNMGFRANDVMAQQLANTDLDPYMNPYTQNVIDNTMADMDRARQITQNDVGAQATAAGAFGGSRHGLVEAENNRNFYDRSGTMAGQLRQAGYSQALQGAQYDIGNNFAGQTANQQAGIQSAALGNQAASTYASNALNQAQMNNQVGMQNAQNQIAGNNSRIGAASVYGGHALNAAGMRNDVNQFNVNAGLTANAQNQAAAGQLAGIGSQQFNQGNTVNQNLAQSGAVIQGINQALINQGQNQFGQFTNAPNTALGLPLAAVGATPQVGTQTTQNNQGLFGWGALATSLLPW